MVKSRVFLYFCLAFILGIFVSYHYFSIIFLLAVLIAGIFLISIFWQRKKAVVIGFCFLFLATGIWHYQQAVSEITYPKEGKVSFIGSVVAEPDVRQNHIKLTVKSNSLPGKVIINAPRYPEYNYGDKIKVTGSLQPPEEDIEGFNYRNYLAKEGVYSVMRWPEISFSGRQEDGLWNRTMSGILSFKDKLRRSIDRSLPMPQSAVMDAMVLGDKRNLPDNLKEDLNFAGLRHITAISGMHIVIIGSILNWLAASLLKLSRNKRFYLTVISLFLFIVMVGLPSSAVRAGIMFTAVLYAAKEGRMNSSSRILVLAAVAMLVHNPLLLAWDVGFQLSFLACLGIIYLGPIFRRLFSGEFNFFSAINAKDLLAATLAAQVFTLPILIYNFGYFSQVAPLANILIVPLLPFIMVSGIVPGLLGIVWPSLGTVLFWPAWLLLSFLTGLSGRLANLPFSVRYLEVSWIWLAVLYLILAGIVFRSRKWIENGFRLR